MASILELFFHSTHRVGRAPFVVGIAVLWGIWGAAGWLIERGVPALALLPVQLLVGYCGLCVLSLRLHDCGRSGWWGWPILAALCFGTSTDGWLAAVLGFSGVLAVVWLGLQPGEQGLNRHGPAPARSA